MRVKSWHAGPQSWEYNQHLNAKTIRLPLDDIDWNIIIFNRNISHFNGDFFTLMLVYQRVSPINHRYNPIHYRYIIYKPLFQWQFSTVMLVYQRVDFWDCSRPKWNRPSDAKTLRSTKSAIKHNQLLIGWLLGLPLWKIWVRQSGWWHSRYMEK